MKWWQNILNVLSFGAYNPEKKFEQEVLGEATINLEEIESLRADVEKAVLEYDKYFPRASNKTNMYEPYRDEDNFDVIDKINRKVVIKNDTVKSVIEAEKELQERGKYVGMDEKTRISAVLSEGRAAASAECLSIMGKRERGYLWPDVVDACRISEYQGYMKFYETGEREANAGGWEFLEDVHGASALRTYSDGSVYVHEDNNVGPFQDGVSFSWSPESWDEMMSEEREQINYEKYIAMIIANDKATRQNDGTYITKTSKEWDKIDKQKEKELRDMPKEELFAQGQALEESLQKRYNELTANREENER